MEPKRTLIRRFVCNHVEIEIRKRYSFEKELTIVNKPAMREQIIKGQKRRRPQRCLLCTALAYVEVMNVGTGV